MFLPHGGGLVAIQFSLPVTNTYAVQCRRTFNRFASSLSMTALLVLFSSEMFAFFFENLNVRELLVNSCDWWCYNQEWWPAQSPVHLKSKVSILLNEGLAVTKPLHVWSWRHPNSKWLIYTYIVSTLSEDFSLWLRQELKESKCAFIIHFSIRLILVCQDLTNFIFLTHPQVSLRSLSIHSKFILRFLYAQADEYFVLLRDVLVQ